MNNTPPRLKGIELYFDDLQQARSFYSETLGLPISDEQPAQYVKFDGGDGFVCLERKGSEPYPSHDKAVLFFKVPDLRATIVAIGRERVLRSESSWAVLHDPEGHNILLIQNSSDQPTA